MRQSSLIFQPLAQPNSKIASSLNLRAGCDQDRSQEGREGLRGAAVSSMGMS